MNRPRNRQPRNDRGRGGTRGGGRGGRRGPSNNSRPDYHPVPSIQQVVVGASVSIVLKQDQPTGREVQGVVQDLLTRGDHPRGIKVRLQDGRVGRVQRMWDGTGSSPQPVETAPIALQAGRRTDRLFENYTAEGPPPRTLADFLPESDSETEPNDHSNNMTFSTATAKCPICGLFEGDEIAVSRHVEEHLT